jgi:hypothetical protein
MADAAITLRSLPRRYSEVLAGAKGDDTWERMVRTPAKSGVSPLGWAARTTALLTELGSAIAALPMQARPAMAESVSDADVSEARLGGLATVLTELKAAATRAADAIEARQHDDFNRTVSLNAKELRAHDVVDQVVLTSVANLKHAQSALDELGTRPASDEE